MDVSFLKPVDTWFWVFSISVLIAILATYLSIKNHAELRWLLILRGISLIIALFLLLQPFPGFLGFALEPFTPSTFCLNVRLLGDKMVNRSKRIYLIFQKYFPKKDVFICPLLVCPDL